MFEGLFRRGRPDEPMTGVVLETSAECQLRCPLCFLRSYPERPDPSLMPLAVVEAVAPFLAGLESVDLTGWGEPLLNPELFAIIDLVRRTFHGRMTMTTNGLLLDRERMERLIAADLDTVCVSMDAADAETYCRARPAGDFDQLTRTLAEFAALRSSGRPLLFGTFLLRAGALAEAPAFVRLAVRLGLDGVVFQQLTGIFTERGLAEACHSAYYGNDFDPRRLEAAMKDALASAPPGFTVAMPEKIGARRVGNCGGFQLSRPFIGAAGLVSVCCAMAYPCALMRRDRQVERTGAVTFGDVRQTPLPEIWRSQAYARARAEIRSGAAPAACGDCIALYLEPGEVRCRPR